MSNLSIPEIPALYGGLDSTALFNGAPVDAAMLRAIALGANRLACKGHIGFRIFGDSDPGRGDTTNPGSFLTYANPMWLPIARGRIPVPKKPGLTAYDVRVSSIIGIAGDEVWVQIETKASPFSPMAAYNSPNVIRIVGTGSQQLVNGPANGIPADPGILDEVTIWTQGQPTNRNGDPADGGTPVTGTGTFEARGPTRTALIDGTANWNITAPNWATTGHYVDILSGGNGAIRGNFITFVHSNTELHFTPALQDEQIRAYNMAGGVTYQIKELPHFRLFDLVGHLFDRTG